jgi:hypothetical protein
MGAVMRYWLRLSLVFLACIGGLTAVAAQADDSNYVEFFTANNNAYDAYLDLNNQTTDASGYRLVNVKLLNMSDAFRGWIKTNFPGGENAAYALDPYSIDCSSKQVGEHLLVFYDSNGFPLTSYDFGGHMAPPITGSMKYYMMQKVCGF